MKHSNSYQNYLDYKNIIELLTDQELSIPQIRKKLDIPQSSLYYKINTLVKENVVKLVKFTIAHHKEQIFTVKKNE